MKGELCRAREDSQNISTERARSIDERIDYDKRIVLVFDQAADDGKPRLWVSAPVCLCVVSEACVPVRVATESGCLT